MAKSRSSQKRKSTRTRTPIVRSAAKPARAKKTTSRAGRTKQTSGPARRKAATTRKAPGDRKNGRDLADERITGSAGRRSGLKGGSRFDFLPGNGNRNPHEGDADVDRPRTSARPPADATDQNPEDPRTRAQPRAGEPEKIEDDDYDAESSHFTDSHRGLNRSEDFDAQDYDTPTRERSSRPREEFQTSGGDSRGIGGSQDEFQGNSPREKSPDRDGDS